MTDREYLQMAVDESRKCTPSRGAYSVGAVIVTREGRVFKGYTHETDPRNHAEEEAIAKAVAAGADLRGAAIYSSMEPCSTRASKPVSCSEHIIRNGFSKVVYALGEPPVFVRCSGASDLAAAGIEVMRMAELAPQVEDINRHLLE